MEDRSRMGELMGSSVGSTSPTSQQYIRTTSRPHLHCVSSLIFLVPRVQKVQYNHFNLFFFSTMKFSWVLFFTGLAAAADTAPTATTPPTNEATQSSMAQGLYVISLPI